MPLIKITQDKYTIVDSEDFEELKLFHWYFLNGYAANGVNGLMHRFILKAPKHLQVDHKNRDRLDNRRSNLRLCTLRQNRQNQNILSTNKSGYRGVSWHHGRWRAQIGSRVNGKSISIGLGSYLLKDDAAHAYDLMAVKLFGEFATINLPSLIDIP